MENRVISSMSSSVEPNTPIRKKHADRIFAFLIIFIPASIFSTVIPLPRALNDLSLAASTPK